MTANKDGFKHTNLFLNFKKRIRFPNVIHFFVTGRFAFDNTAAQSQNAVSLYFTKTHVLHFAFLEQNTAWYIYLE